MTNITTEKTKQIINILRELNSSLRVYQKCSPFCRGITFTQFNILDLIQEKSEIEIRELTEKLAVDKSTTTRLIEPLLNEALVIKEQSNANRRANVLLLTGKGKVVYQEVKNCIESFFNHVDTDELDQMMNGFQIFNKYLNPNCCN